MRVIKSYECDAGLGAIDVEYEYGIDGLIAYFDHMLDDNRRKFFGETLKKIIDLALQLPEICTKPVRLLRKQVAVNVY